MGSMGQSVEIIGRNAPALAFLLTIIGVVHFNGRQIANVEREIAVTSEKIESLGRETRSAFDSLRRESDSKINESRAATERFAIEYQLKYNHSDERKSLQNLSKLPCKNLSKLHFL